MNLEIIIDGVHHKLVKDEYASCGKCSLQRLCQNLCENFSVRDDEYFQTVEIRKMINAETSAK